MCPCIRMVGACHAMLHFDAGGFHAVVDKSGLGSVFNDEPPDFVPNEDLVIKYRPISFF